MWTSKPTPYNVGDEQAAADYARTRQKLKDDQRRRSEGGPLTVAEWAKRWIEERETLQLATLRDDKGRLEHVLERIGGMLITTVKPKDIRDLVRSLRRTELAPRTIRNIYGVTHTMFRDAAIEEVIETNPCMLKRDDLPAKMDKDPEWRSAATYTRAEVRALITDECVPAVRRIQYALKALAGLRHGEVAGLRWRHHDATAEPLARLVIATSYNKGRTKTEVTRRVPVHAELAQLLAAWRATWAEIHGREPETDDLVAPTKDGALFSANLAGKYMRADLGKLGLRAKASSRNRGGHDLRAWFITTCQECGAHRDLLRVITHTAQSDVIGGYTRASWPALCAEVAKLTL
ncbi:MAG TPA: hypothetical protein VIV58_27565 [Kofleriaceae bacterium]